MKSNSSIVRWFEIPVGDLQRARSFYESIFEMTLQVLEINDDLRMALFPGGQSGALLHAPDFYKAGTEGPLLYLDADPDLNDVLERVEGAGGAVLVPKTQISEERGYMGIFRDTEGNRIGLMSSD